MGTGFTYMLIMTKQVVRYIPGLWDKQGFHPLRTRGIHTYYGHPC